MIGLGIADWIVAPTIARHELVISLIVVDEISGITVPPVCYSALMIYAAYHRVWCLGCGSIFHDGAFVPQVEDG